MKKIVGLILICLALLGMTAFAETEIITPAFDLSQRMTIAEAVEITPETDPDGLLNALEGYSSKISWTDAISGDACYLEYFESHDAAAARVVVLTAENENAVQIGQYVMRLGANVSEEDAENYRAAFSEAAGTAYVANKNTDKFHHADCSSVPQIKEKNRMDFTGDRQALIDQGFVPCKRCKP